MYDRSQLIEDAAKLRKSGYFDPSWYRANYPDVDRVGMDPAEHYLKYGMAMRRDPGPHLSTSFYLDSHKEIGGDSFRAFLELLHRQEPNDETELCPDRHAVLLAAANVADRGSHARAIELAERYLPENLAYTAHILRANAAIAHGQEAEWLQNLNAYLGHFGLAFLSLEGEGALLDRFSTRQLPSVTGGPRVSVIMPAWNAKETVRAAARSILKQTWRNLELLIVDDASEDGTWAVLQEIAATDDRVKIRRNRVNVGPYVSKNLALTDAKGDWITGHDADDWAHPQRLERHLCAVIKTDKAIRASRTYLIRMERDGMFKSIGRLSGDRLDGVALLAPVSAIFERNLLIDELGSWNCSRFGADNELISRAKFLQGTEFDTQEFVSMICLDLDGSLTNNPHFGISKKYGFGSARKAYHKAWKTWHSKAMTIENVKYNFPPKTGNFDLPEHARVRFEDIIANIDT